MFSEILVMTRKLQAIKILKIYLPMTKLLDQQTQVQGRAFWLLLVFHSRLYYTCNTQSVECSNYTKDALLSFILAKYFIFNTYPLRMHRSRKFCQRGSNCDNVLGERIQYHYKRARQRNVF